MVLRLHGVRLVTVQLPRLFARMAVFGVLAFALGLAACGRKTGLEPPPSAAIEPPPADAQPSGAPAPQPGVASPGPAGVKKRLPIDPILD
jgi:predicted small lipoprotein YifL